MPVPILAEGDRTLPSTNALPLLLGPVRACGHGVRRARW
jgi:hypothetical protein